MVPFSIWEFGGELAMRNPLFDGRGVVKVLCDIIFDMGHFYIWIDHYAGLDHPALCFNCACQNWSVDI